MACSEKALSQVVDLHETPNAGKRKQLRASCQQRDNLWRRHLYKENRLICPKASSLKSGATTLCKIKLSPSKSNSCLLSWCSKTIKLSKYSLIAQCSVFQNIVMRGWAKGPIVTSCETGCDAVCNLMRQVDESLSEKRTGLKLGVLYNFFGCGKFNYIRNHFRHVVCNFETMVC